MDFWQTLAAVVIGGLIAPIGSVIVGTWEHGQQRRTVAAAIRAEIEAILNLADRRDHFSHFQAHLDDWRRGKRLDKTPGVHGIDSEDDVPIYRANLMNLGFLGPERAARIVSFYMAVLGIRGDIIALNTPSAVETIEDRIALVEEMLDIWCDSTKLGKSLIEDLR